jgi:anaerobic selenocysteine-containing dehydrogenase
MKYPVFGKVSSSGIFLYPEKKTGYEKLGEVECENDCPGCAVGCIARKVVVPQDTDKKAYDIILKKTCRRVEITIKRSNIPGIGKVVGKNQADRYQITYNAISLGFEGVAY